MVKLNYRPTETRRPVRGHYVGMCRSRRKRIFIYWTCYFSSRLSAQKKRSYKLQRTVLGRRIEQGYFMHTSQPLPFRSVVELWTDITGIVSSQGKTILVNATGWCSDPVAAVLKFLSKVRFPETSSHSLRLMMSFRTEYYWDCIW